MGARILVVEDTPDSLELMTFLLETHDHTVVGAETGEQAIELAAAARPDLVVMDLQLPGIDGYQALIALQATPELVAVPVIAVTSFAMVGDRNRVLDAGFEHYVTKPIDPKTFAEEINSRLPEHLRGSPPLLTGVDVQVIATEADEQYAGDILVLDDSLTNQTLLRSVLEPHGYQVRTAFTVEEAIAAADGKRPDLVLSDVHVGEQRGISLLHYLRTVPSLAVVPFGFITASADWRDPLIREGTVRIIHRPIDPKALLDEVRTLMMNQTGN
jgi:two-component system cell cycle response regulator